MSFKIVDGHQDLLWHIKQDLKVYQTSPQQLDRSLVRAIFASIFTDDLAERQQGDYVNRDLREYQRLVDNHPNLYLAKTFGDFDQSMHQSGQTALMLHLEGLDCLDCHNWQEQLVYWHMCGVLSAGLVGNHSNRLGGGCKDSGRLTQLGRAVVRWMNRNKMIVDLAHTNPDTFYDVLDVVDKPPVVSHGNARVQANRRRNYTNDQLRALADHGGVIGVSFVPGFVRTDRLPNLDDLAEHIMYIINIIGLNHVAIGSDLGGILSPRLIPRAGHVSEIDLLLYTLNRKGMQDHELHLLSSGNWERILRTNLL